VNTFSPQEEEELLKQLELQENLPTMLLRFRRKLAVRVVCDIVFNDQRYHLTIVQLKITHLFNVVVDVSMKHKTVY
jgi:hypothetical protein